MSEFNTHTEPHGLSLPRATRSNSGEFQGVIVFLLCCLSQGRGFGYGHPAFLGLTTDYKGSGYFDSGIISPVILALTEIVIDPSRQQSLAHY